MSLGFGLPEWERWLEHTVRGRLNLSVPDFEAAYDAGTLPAERVRDLGPLLDHIRKLRSSGTRAFGLPEWEAWLNDVSRYLYKLPLAEFEVEFDAGRLPHAVALGTVLLFVRRLRLNSVVIPPIGGETQPDGR